MQTDLTVDQLGKCTPYGAMRLQSLLAVLSAHLAGHDPTWDGLDQLLLKATPVIWRCEVWNATHGGCDEIASEPITAADMPDVHAPELWIIDDGCALASSGENRVHAVLVYSTGETVVAIGFPFDDKLADGTTADQSYWNRAIALSVADIGECQSLWPCGVSGRRFMMSTAICDVSTVDPQEGLPRHERRRIKNSGRPVPAVRVVNLRRVERDGHDPEPTDRHYSCRWVVSAHWRRQWFARAQGHKTIPIAAYLKGPDDAPLKAPAPKLVRVAR